MKKNSIISILFVLIAFQIITQKVSAQSNYHDYSDSQKADIFLDHFNDNWHVWPYIRDGDTWTGKIENGYMHWESKDKSSISQEKIIPSACFGDGMRVGGLILFPGQRQGSLIEHRLTN